jgi:hypothetical protein
MSTLSTLVHKIERLKQETAAARGAAEHLAGKLRVYPPPSYGKRSGGSASAGKTAWKTVRQQRYFFWALKQGRLTLPYRRTGQFKQNWVITAQNNGLTQLISNATPCGPLLMDKQRQSLQAKRTGWPTVEAVLSSERSAMLKAALSRERPLFL